MVYNNADIELLAGLNLNSSEAEILRAIKILEKRIRKNSGAKITLDATLDDTALKAAIEKLQNILQGKDLSADTKNSIKAIAEEANAMLEVVSAAKKASEEKLEFADANKKVRESAEDTADAINRERDAMENLEDIDYVLSNINMHGRQGQSVFQQFGDTIRNAFYAYTAANLLQDALHEIIDAGEEGVETVKELNDALTSLRMATGQSYESVKGLLGAYNELGQELGAITVDVSESADEWLRQGHAISDTNELIKDSLMLSKISNLESAESTKYLTSAMQGYRVAAEDVIRIVDKLSAVDLESATDAGGLAEAMSRTAEGARIAGVEMDRLLGMIATVGEVTQKSMSSIGEAYKTTFSRMRDIKDNKLSIIGEDGEIEDISNVEIVLESLGIKLRNSNLEFRNFQEVLDDVGASWDKYTSVQKAAIAKAFSGTRQQENFLVMMENWDKVLEYTEVAANSAGTAEEKFGYYLESLEAKTNSLKASLENLASVTISDELYGSVLDTTKAVVDMTAETGILKGTLAGLGTAGAIYTLQHLANYLHNATQEFANLGEAMQITRNANGTITDIQRLIDLTGGLSQSQTRLLLSTNNLTDAQKIAILMNQGLTRAEAQQQIQTWGVATAQQGATTATISFSTALRGLWTTLMANPLVLISTAVTIGVTAFNKYKQVQEEAARVTKEAAEEANELGDEISSLATKYIQLTEAVETDENAKEELLSVQEDILKALGLEADSIDDLIFKYGSLSNAIKQVSIDKLRESQIDLIAGIDVAKDELTGANDSGFLYDKNIINATGADSIKAFKELEKAGIITKGSYGSDGGAFVLTGDDETVEGALENYHRLEDALEALRDSDEFTAEELSGNKLYQGLYKRYKEIKDEVQAYETAVGNLNENIVQQNALIALQGQEIPKTKDAFDNFRDGIVKTINVGSDFMGSESDIRNTLDKYLATLPEFKQFYLDLSELEEDVNAFGGSVVNSEFISDTQKKALDEYKKTLEQIAKIKENGSNYSDLLTTFPEYDWSAYLSGAESLDMALRKIASESFADVKGQFKGMSEVEPLLEELRKSLLDSFEIYDFGWTDNLGHYNELVELLERVREGKKFTRDEITDILADYDLHGDIKALGDGFTIDGNAIKSLVNQYAEAHNESLQKVREALEIMGINPDSLLGENSYKAFLDTSKDSRTNDFCEEIDWAAQSVEVLERNLSKLENTLDNTKSWDNQVGAIQDVIDAQKELQDAYQQSGFIYSAKYQNALNNGIIAEQGLSKAIKNKIESGEVFEIQPFIDEIIPNWADEGIKEQLYDAIQKAIDWYNKRNDAEDNKAQIGYEIDENELSKNDFFRKYLDSEQSRLESEKQRIQDQIDLNGGKGTVEQYQQMIQKEKEIYSSIENRLKKEKEILGTLEPNTDAYEEQLERIRDCEDGLADCEKNTKEWGQAILELPLREVEEIIDGLNERLEDVEDQLENMDTIIAGAQAYIQNEIDAQEELKEVVQDQLDALQEANDERERALALEKAQYELERARSQHTVKVYKGEGKGFVYEQNMEDVRNAQENLDQLEFEDTVHQLEKQIKYYDDIIEDLQEAKDEWGNIASDTEDYLNIQKALSQLDPEDIFNVSVIETYASSYKELLGTAREYEEQLKTWEEFLRVIEEIVSKYEVGVYSFEEASKEIDKTSNDYLSKLDEFKIKNEDGIEVVNEDKIRTVIDKILGAYLPDLETGSKESDEAIKTEAEKTYEAITRGLQSEVDAQKVILNQFTLDMTEKFTELCNNMVSQVNLAFEQINSNIATIASNISSQVVQIVEDTKKQVNELKDLASNVDETTITIESKGGIGGSREAVMTNLQAFHTGIENGLVGEKSGEQLKSVALRKLEPDEIPAVLKVNEAVLTQLQQQNVMSNMATAFKAGTQVPQVERNSIAPVVQDITISCPNVTNESGYNNLMREIQKLPLQTIQYANKRK